MPFTFSLQYLSYLKITVVQSLQGWQDQDYNEKFVKIFQLNLNRYRVQICREQMKSSRQAISTCDFTYIYNTYIWIYFLFFFFPSECIAYTVICYRLTQSISVQHSKYCTVLLCLKIINTKLISDSFCHIQTNSGSQLLQLLSSHLNCPQDVSISFHQIERGSGTASLDQVHQFRKLKLNEMNYSLRQPFNIFL